jgi:ribonuclease P protein component
VTWLPGTTLQVAYVVRRHEGTAILRNRIKRRLRSIVEELAPSLPPGSYLLQAERPAATQDFEHLREDVAVAVSNLTSKNRQ